MKERPLGSIDDLIAEIAGIPIEELVTEPTEDGRHLISVDELRAAGALDVPAAWRKSLANESSYTLPGFGDDEEDGENQSATQVDDESTESTEEFVRTEQPHDSTSSSAHRPHQRRSKTAQTPG